MSRRGSLTKYEHQIVEGSIKQIAEKTGKSLANALFDADAVAYVDTSGSMGVGVGGDYFGGKTCHDQAQEDLAKLQAEFPGKLAVYSWSSEEPVWCPDGIPHRFNGGTEMRKALEHMKKYDDTGMALYLLSDGYPEDRINQDDYSYYPDHREVEKHVLDFARTFKSPIHTIYIGPESNTEARDFMRKLAEATGGRFAKTKEMAALYDPTKKFMLLDGIKPEQKESKGNDTISL